MEEKLTAIKEAALNEIASVENSAALEEIRVKYLGKKGELTTILRGMGSLSPEERPVVGKLVNIAKNEVETKLEEVGSKIKEKEKKAKLASEVIDNFTRKETSNRKETSIRSNIRKYEEHLHFYGIYNRRGARSRIRSLQF